MRHYRRYTDEDLLKGVKKVKSLAGLLRFLNLKPAGGNFANVKRLLQKLKANTDHWTGQAWCRGQQLKDWTQYTKASHLKPHLIKSRTHQCERCHLNQWIGFPIPIEIHHKDGDRTNNLIDNLELLCNNCHALTDFWRNKKRVSGAAAETHGS